MDKRTKILTFAEILLFILMQLYISSTLLIQSISPFFEIVFWGTICIVFFIYVMKSIKAQNKILTIQYLFVIYYIYILISCVRLDSLKLSLHGIYEYIFYTFSFFVAFYIYKNIKLENYKVIIYSSVFIIMTTILAILGIVELLNGKLLLGGQIHYFDASSLSYVRSQVFSGSPLIFGTLMGCYSIVLLFFYLKSHNIVFLFSTILTFVGMSTSGSRGPLIATFAGYVICLSAKYFFSYFNAIQGMKIILKYILLAFGILVVCIYIAKGYTGNNPILIKVFSIFNWDTDIGNVGRLKTWSKYIQLLKENWLFGTGVATTGSVTIDVPGNIGVTESSLLKLLVELGIIGFITQFAIITYVLQKGIRNFNNISERNKGLLILCIAIVSAIFVEGLVLQITEIFNVSIILWFCLGLIYAISDNGIY